MSPQMTAQALWLAETSDSHALDSALRLAAAARWTGTIKGHAVRDPGEIARWQPVYEIENGACIDRYMSRAR